MAGFLLPDVHLFISAVAASLPCYDVAMNPHQRLTPMFGPGVATQGRPLKSVEEQGDDTQMTDLLPDLSRYTLTVGEAASVMLNEHCKFASSRKVQRLCKNGDIDCYKLTTTRGGQPVSEWLVDETSLLKRISELETKVVDGVANLPPKQIGVANDAKNIGADPNVMATPNALGDAMRTAEKENEVEDNGNDCVPPELAGDANGETRTMASVLIENAQLTSALEGPLLELPRRPCRSQLGRVYLPTPLLAARCLLRSTHVGHR